MKWIPGIVIVMAVASAAFAEDPHPKRVELWCHRTANQDVPENTLESLEQAALLGCDVVEVDVRRTMDGRLVLNHDGFLERLTDGIGEIEDSDYDDLRLRDAGAWMNPRFEGFRIPLFEDALRLARHLKLRLVLDVKVAGTGAAILEVVKQEGMTDRVQFGGESSDIKQLYPQLAINNSAWVEPGVMASEIAAFHSQGKTVIANFSANNHGMDLAGMKAAVSAGVDGLNVDYPRLGADAVGRPVEQQIARLIAQAGQGTSDTRARAVLELSRYSGFPLQPEFAKWLLDADDKVSRAAAIGLVKYRPAVHPAIFEDALRSPHAVVRANAAWALGVLVAPAQLLLPMLHDSDVHVRAEALDALSKAPGHVPARSLLPVLSNPDATLRGPAAVALARHQPAIAAIAVPRQIRAEVRDVSAMYKAWLQRGKTPLTPAEIDRIVLYYRCQTKEMQALSMLHGPAATRMLNNLAFRPGRDFAEMDSIMAAFDLWDRIGGDANPAIVALGSSDAGVADRAEWILIHAGPAVLPSLRKLIVEDKSPARMRAIRIVAWQGDIVSLSALHTLEASDAGDADLIAWAIQKIITLHPE